LNGERVSIDCSRYSFHYRVVLLFCGLRPFFSKCGHGLQVRFKVGRRPCRGEGRLMLPLRPNDIRTNKLAHSMSRVFGCISHSGTHGNSHVAARTHSFVYLVTSFLHVKPITFQSNIMDGKNYL
jgi:hypothetical protein